MQRTTGSIPATISGAAPVYVKHNGDVYPCCQSYMLDGAPLGNIAREAARQKFGTGGPMQEMRRMHAAGRGGEVDICSRCCTTIPHPLLVAEACVSRQDGATVDPAGGADGALFEAAAEAAASAAAEDAGQVN